MAVVYILHSSSIDQYYIGSCFDLNQRIEQHLNKAHQNAFTRKANDWKLFFEINNLEYQTARKIEAHIKMMKSRTYIENLVRYPEITQKLIEKYHSDSAR